MGFSIDILTDDRYSEPLLSKLTAFNRRHVPDLERVSDAATFYVVATDESENFIGGISARCFWNMLHIDLFWVDDAERSKGLGGRLLRTCEDRGREAGCAIAFLETFSWQAKPFYERQGYDLLGTIEDCPKGHAIHYMTKRL